jgi:hypothetical protein
MGRDTEWFRRMGDIPGLDFASPDVERDKLPGHDREPEVQSYEFDGERRESLWWPTPDGDSSGSPAQTHNQDDEQDRPASEVIRRLYESLELPGQPADYHFAIQGTAALLWNRRREEPNVLTKVEELSWLDIRLAEAWPRAVSYDSGDGETYFSITALYTLIKLYEREGFIREALAVVDRAKSFGRQVPGERERLEQKLAAIESEGQQ